MPLISESVKASLILGAKDWEFGYVPETEIGDHVFTFVRLFMLYDDLNTFLSFGNFLPVPFNH